MLRRLLVRLSLVFFFAVSIAVTFAPRADAQHSGGSFGGGSFHGGGGGGFGGSGGSGGFHGGGFGDSTGGGSHGSALPGSAPSGAFVFGTVIVVLLFMAWVRFDARRHMPPLPGPQARAWMNVDVSVVRIGVDARSREFLQRELSGLARRRTSTTTELHASLLRVVRLLRKCDTAWILGGASNHHPMSPPVAEATFRRHAHDARSAFSVELVRNERGVATTKQSPGYAANASEGEGAALITLVVAARREIRDFAGGRREEIHAVLDDLERLSVRDLVAMEVVWMPADPNDRMSSATLVANVPTLEVLPGAIGGRVNCAFCKGPFAAELPTCPHCGAASPRA